MAVRITFKPGMKQSQQAARYFHDTVGGLVEALLEGCEEHHFRITADHGAALQIRIWSATAPDQEVLHGLMDLLLGLRADLRTLQEDPGGQDRVAKLATDWLSVHLGGADLYAELAVEHPGPVPEERPEFALGLVHGRCAMISTDTVLFTWLDDSIFGLAVAGHGSYLVETVSGANAEHHRWRRAS
ncbi:MAG TPA: hypothetical protein PLB89_14975 [Flavobacteriales bacterium]|nr:hypothetical protein [Flavobacteriales bacterium]